MTGIEVRRARADDCSEILSLLRQSVSSAWRKEDIVTALEGKHDVISVLFIQGRLKGFVHYTMVVDHGEVINIVVAPDARSRGLGTQLISVMLKEMRDHGCEKCFLEVRSSNAPAIALYRHHGFIETGRRLGYYNGEDALLMERVLRPCA